MSCNVYFSFDYGRDLHRVNHIRHIDSLHAHAAAGFRDAEQWQAAICIGETEVRRMIDAALIGTKVSVICIGTDTAASSYLEHEIEMSTRRGNTVIAVKISQLAGADRLPSPVGAIPSILNRLNIPVYTYKNPESFAVWIEKAARVGCV